MTESELDAILVKIRVWCESQPSIKRAWIFGSYAKRQQTESSDLDLAILIHAHDGEHLAEWIFNADKWRRQLNKLTASEISVDLQAAFEEDEIVMPPVREHGQLIYNRTQT